MAKPPRQIESEALKLPPRARARLAERLINSLDRVADAASEAEWLREAERRVDEVRNGKVRARSATGVLRRVRAALR